MIIRNYLEKAEKTEWLLADLFACRSLTDIAKNAGVVSSQNRPGYEVYTYKGTPVLEVEYIVGDVLKSTRWDWRIPL